MIMNKKKISDIDSSRIIMRNPDKSLVLLTNGRNESQGFIIEHIELRQYIENVDPFLGNYSLLTVLIKTDKGEVEMKYDEGFRDINVVELAAIMLTQYAGFGSLINRALIELQR
ncbi:MAG: hypothetical protein ACJ71K_21080 [Nitrososphaeraceae archaeon]